MNKEYIMNKEKELLKEISEYVEMFNSVCKQIGAQLLSQIPKNRDLHIYNEAVCNLIKHKPNEPISLFVTKVYADDKYRTSILKSNEDFFMKHDHEELAKGDSNGSDIVDQVKNCWSQINDETKFFIKEAFKTLINLCEIYIEKKDDLHKLKTAEKLKRI